MLFLTFRGINTRDAGQFRDRRDKRTAPRRADLRYDSNNSVALRKSVPAYGRSGVPRRGGYRCVLDRGAIKGGFRD